MEFTDEETTQLIAAFKALGLKPKMDKPETLQQWMVDFVKATSVGDDDGEEVDPDKPDSSSEAEDTLEKPANTPVTVVSHPPRLSTFSGDPQAKGDTTFDLWKYEVQCLLKEATHPVGVLVQAIRKSLKGEAGRIAMRLGPNAPVTRLLEKLEGVYGTVERGESLLADFYSAQQGDEESVVMWGCRLEDMLDKAKRKGHVTSSSIDEMLRTKFWLGLQPQLKDKSRHLFDKCKTFDNIRVQLRIIEHEQKVQQGGTIVKDTKKTGQVKAANAATVASADHQAKHEKDMLELKGMVHQLTTTVQTLQQDFVKLGARAHGKSTESIKSLTDSSNLRVEASSFTPAQSQLKSPSTQPASINNCFQGPQCWRCGQYGHLKNGCRVRLDHKKLLN